MDDLILIQQLQKKLKASFQNVGDVMISGVLTTWTNTSTY
jgi:hypothetical protein